MAARASDNGSGTAVSSPYWRDDGSGGVSLDVVGLFAGIGGLELGLGQSGHSARALIEVDAAAVAVLKTQFPNVRLHDDVRTFRIPDNVGLVSAGFPCTDLSQAGRTAGITGAASGLITGVLDQIGRKRRHRRPDWLLIENVPFLLRLGRGAGIRFLVDRVSELGYRWAYRVVDTAAFGLPQRRRRVFLVAGLIGDPREVLFADEAGPRDSEAVSDVPPVGFYWTEGNTGIGWVPGALPTLKGGSGLSIPSPPAIWLSSRIATPHITDAERLQGFEAGWTASAVEAVGSDRPRWKLVGNAVSVPVAKWLGDRLAHPGPVRTSDLGTLNGGPWPEAAWGNSEGGRTRVHVVGASDSPVRMTSPDLLDFLLEDPADLSRKATLGFLSRLTRSRLRQRNLSSFTTALADHALSQGARRSDLPRGGSNEWEGQ